MSKVVAPRDTKPDFRRELTKSNPLPMRTSKRKNRRTFFIKPDGRRISLNSKSGLAILDRETFTKRHKLDPTVGKMFDYPVPWRKIGRLVPGRASAGRRRFQKRGATTFFSGHETAFLRETPVLPRL